MRSELLQLMDTLAKGILFEEGCVYELAEMAALAERDGNSGFAEAARTLSHKRCVKAMELRGQLAALSERSGIRTEDN